MSFVLVIPLCLFVVYFLISSYGRYVEGTGSVLQCSSETEVCLDFFVVGLLYLNKSIVFVDKNAVLLNSTAGDCIQRTG